MFCYLLFVWLKLIQLLIHNMVLRSSNCQKDVLHELIHCKRVFSGKSVDLLERKIANLFVIPCLRNHNVINQKF